MRNPSRFSIEMIACFFIEASAFQIGNRSRYPQFHRISSSLSRLYSTPIQDMPVATSPTPIPDMPVAIASTPIPDMPVAIASKPIPDMQIAIAPTPIPDMPVAITSFEETFAVEPDVSATDFILSEIGLHDVVVFSTTYCPHCMQTKQLFERLGIDAKVIELDKIKNGLGPAKNSIALKLLELTGQRTVPNVFLLGKHLGGNDQAHDAARSGALKHVLFNAL